MLCSTFRSAHLPLAILAFLVNAAWGFGQGNDVPLKNQPAAIRSKFFQGTWTYRSFRSNPDLSVPANDLLFGSGTMEISVSGAGQLTGTLGGAGWQLDLSGTVTESDPAKIRFQGKGTINREEWIYDYIGFQVPVWPNGVDQRPAIVGSIIRTVPHSGGSATAGYVAQWIAVKQDAVVQPANRSRRDAANPNMESRTNGALPTEKRPAFLSEFSARRTSISNLLKRDSLLELQKQTLLDSEMHLAAPERLSKSRQATVLFQNPTEKDAAEGTVSLEVRYGTNFIGPQAVKLRSYNGLLVGPTLRVKAGHTLRVSLKNSLPPEPAGTPHVVNGHHAWNTTNLHTHGLHVKPQANPESPDPAPLESDNVLIGLAPSPTPQEYAFEIPPDHPAGTFWYHAHKHGSTSAQVSSGMAGALIVTRDDDPLNLDSIPEVAAASQEGREKIMVFQQIPYLVWDLGNGASEGRIELRGPNGTSAVFPMFGPNQWGPSERYTTINGQQLPVIEFAPGEIQRWRMIDSGFRETLSLQIIKDPEDTGSGPDHIDFCEIAVDGLATNGRTITSFIEMFPGYRSDVLVQAPSVPGTYHLIDAGRQIGTLLGEAESLKFIAKVVVKDVPAVVMSLPTDAQIRSKRLPPLPEPDESMPIQHAYYGLSNGFVIGRTDPGVNGAVVGEQFAMDPIDLRVLPLGAVQRWRIGTRNDFNFVGEAPPPPPRGPAHPFHIHVNPFEIVSIKDPQGVEQLPTGTRIWRDTLSMPPGFTIEFLTQYADFAGSFVQHCHILDHEDRGMMEKITIRDLSTSPQVTAVPAASTSDSPLAPGGSGKPSVMFFVKGSFCPHCMSQLTEMAKSLAEQEADVTVVTASSKADLEAFPKVPFRIVSDVGLKLFKAHGAFDGEVKHATIVRDRAGKVLLQKVGDEPFMDSTAVASALAQTATSFVIAVRGTDDVEDDYLTWSPTACTIRMVNGQPGGGLVIVTLTNGDLSAHPDTGELRFATTLAPKSTATLPSVTLELNPDGTPVNFYVAGFKASTATPATVPSGGRDTKIVIRQGSETGPQLGEHSVMVRVRKALRHPDDPLPKMSDFEFEEFLKALRDLHQLDHRLEWYVRMHRLATGHGTFADPGFGDPPDPRWPDLAHGGSGFIAWHRAFLLQFERELQVRYPHVALPYWVQGTPQTIFSGTRLGEPASSGDVVEFDPGSPLYGWSISLPMDRGSTTAPMGYLRRRPLDHNDPLAPALAGFPAPQNVYRQWPDFLGFPDSDRFSRIRRVESNPHNNGHGAVGPNGIWMSNCRESNADPVFYVFHCNHDYLWAKWQYEMDRFLNDGSDPAHYSPADAFTDPTADRAIPFGHHLKDTMWPWDGTEGDGPLGATSNRPSANGFGAFPVSTLPALWPSGPAEPRPMDMIDYQGLLTSTNDLGFCYDSVPFGARTGGPAPEIALAASKAGEKSQVAMAVISNQSASADTRLLAIQSLDAGLGVAGKQAGTILSEIVSNPKEPPDIRSAAFQQWFAASPMDAFNAALPIAADKQVPLSVRLTTITNAVRQMHFSEIPHSEGHRVLGLLRTVLEEENPAALKAAAIRHLAPTGDPAAKDAVLASLDARNPPNLELQEAVSLLRFFPDQKQRLREFVSSPSDPAAIAAIQGLFNDADSLDGRRRLARDIQRSTEVRTAAIRSLMHDDQADSTEFLATMAADPQTDLGLRVEALASLAVRLRKNLKNMTVVEKQAWQKRLEAIHAADTTGFGAVRREAIRVVSSNK